MLDPDGAGAEPPGLARGAPDHRSAGFQRFLDDVVLDAAGDRRAARRWLQQAAGEEATFTGILRDLAEAGVDVRIDTTAGNARRGVIRGVGRDFVAVPATGGALLFVATAAIIQVRAGAGGRTPVGARGAAQDVTLAEALSGFAPARPDAVAWCGRPGGEVGVVAGRLVAGGRDVITVRLGGPHAGDAYLPVATVAEVLVTP